MSGIEIVNISIFWVMWKFYIVQYSQKYIKHPLGLVTIHKDNQSNLLGKFEQKFENVSTENPKEACWGIWMTIFKWYLWWSKCAKIYALTWEYDTWPNKTFMSLPWHAFMCFADVMWEWIDHIAISHSLNWSEW